MPITMKRPKNVQKMAYYRCDGHLALVPRYKLTKFDGDSLCPKCLADARRSAEIAARPDRHKSKDYYAVQIFVSESKAVQNIRNAFRKAGLTSYLGDVVIPKERAAKTSPSYYDAYDHDGRLLGRVIGSDADEATFNATRRFSKMKGGRGAYHPDHHVATGDTFSHVVRIKTRTYQAISDTGRVMGVLGGYPSKKLATEAAAKLYGPKVREDASPREPSVKRGEVAKVVLVREGGKKVVRNKKTMAGYILVRLEADPLNELDPVLALVKRTFGVSSLMPWQKPMNQQELKSVEAGKLSPPPAPCPVPDAVVVRLKNSTPPAVKTLKYSAGDFVLIADGPFKGQKVTLTEVAGDGDDQIATFTTKVLGVTTEAYASYGELRRI